MVDEAYEAGRRDNRILTLETAKKEHAEKMEKFDARLVKLERISWIVLGVVLAFQGIPYISKFLAIVGKGS